VKTSTGDRVLLESIERHLDACFGDGERMVMHELVSPLIHVDIHIVAPSDEYPVTRLVTSGMAERAMTVPAESSAPRYAELTIPLPPNWPIGRRSMRAMWPFLALQDTARSIHDIDTFLCDGVTVSNGNPARPYARGTDLCGALIVPPYPAPEAFDDFECDDGRKVELLQLFPLREDEIAFKLEHGLDALYERLEAAGVSDIVDPARPSVLA
jgi:Suppressor of fused protein (SUFU)